VSEASSQSGGYIEKAALISRPRQGADQIAPRIRYVHEATLVR